MPIALRGPLLKHMPMGEWNCSDYLEMQGWNTEKTALSQKIWTTTNTCWHLRPLSHASAEVTACRHLWFLERSSDGHEPEGKKIMLAVFNASCCQTCQIWNSESFQPATLIPLTQILKSYEPCWPSEFERNYCGHLLVSPQRVFCRTIW